MRIDKKGTVVAGLGVLLLLAAFVLLASRNTNPVMPSSTVSPASSGISITRGILVTTEHNISTIQQSALLTSTPFTRVVGTNISITKNITASITPVENSTVREWLAFTDQEAGYSVQYPKNSYIQPIKEGEKTYKTISIDFQIPNQPYQGMSISIEPNPQNLPIDKFFSGLYQKINNKPLDLSASHMLEQIEFADMAAYKTNGLYGDIQILLPYQDKVYFFSLGYGIAGGASSPEAEMIFFQILDTFQIIP